MNRLLVIAFLLLVNTAFGITYNADGTITPDIEWYVKNVRAEQYEIHNANELAGFAALVNGTSNFPAYNFYGKRVVLANDIDFESYVDDEGLWHAPEWTPIGINYSCHFAGSFDGNGHCVKNLVVRGVQSGAFFGYNGGEIKNLVMAGGMVSCDYYGAGICSFNTGVIDHCISTVNIYCNNYGGGICGKNYGNGKLLNCISLGYVQPGNFCGGVIGSNSPVPLSTVISNCVYDEQMCPLKRGCGNADSRNVKNLNTAQIVQGQGYNAESFVLENGMYPRLANSEWTLSMKAALTPVTLQQGESVHGVIKNIKLLDVEGVAYTSPSDSVYMSIAANECKFNKRAAVVLCISGGGCTRYVNMTVTNATLDFAGTQSRQVMIDSYEDLKCFAIAVNNCTHYKGFANVNGFKDVHFSLSQCIRIPDGVNWEPVGTVNSPFRGVFNGQGCVISNINVMRPNQKYCGLFGYCTGKIMKLVTVGGQIVGGDYTGGICGYMNEGTLEACLSAVPVRGHYYTGGILGFSNVSKLMASMHVNSVVGQPEFTGGICGGTIDGTIRYCSFDNKLCTGYPAVAQVDDTQIMHTYGYRTESMVGTSIQTLYTAYAKDFYWEQNMYPLPASTAHHQEAKVAATPVFIADNEDVRNLKSYIEFGDFMDITYSCDQSDVLKINPDIAFPLKQGAVVLSIKSGDVRKDVALRIVNKALEPVGSESNPLLIASYSDFNKLRDAVNYGTDYKGFACIEGFKGVHFKLVDNIRCPSGEPQLPVGNNLFPFCGIFDGNNKAIINFNCAMDNMDNVGVFGYNAGEICNLRVSLSPIRGRYYAGGICGYNAGHIECCYHDSASVTGTSYAGGICGFSEGTVLKCTNSGPIRSEFYAGGISGSNIGRVDTCVNQGLISGSSCIGGISGTSSSPILFSFNSGRISGSDNVGGISGRNSYSTVQKCRNVGVVKGQDCSGGIVGLNDGVVMQCDNNNFVISSSSGGGIVGRGGKVFSCVNRGEVSNTSATGLGGIVGTAKANSVISRCINYGKLTAGSQVGGICADNLGTITSCVNFGEVQAGYCRGGIVAYNSGSVFSCYVSAKLQGEGQVGAICAVERTGSEIDKCIFNTDLVTTKGIGGDEPKGKTVGMDTRLIQSVMAMKNQLKIDDFVFEENNYPLPKLNDDEPEPVEKKTEEEQDN